VIVLNSYLDIELEMLLEDLMIEKGLSRKEALEELKWRPLR
jgi:hypothetical protein